jgi:hypothetical protein
LGIVHNFSFITTAEFVIDNGVCIFTPSYCWTNQQHKISIMKHSQVTSFWQHTNTLCLSIDLIFIHPCKFITLRMEVHFTKMYP